MDFLENTTTLERQLFAHASQHLAPINGSIELLPLCNMKCDMCYVRMETAEVRKMGGLRSADEWISVAKEMKDAGVLFLLLTGGEPFLYPEFRQLYLALQKMGFVLTINTNGTLITEDLAAFLGEHKPRRVNVTLYGTNEETYQHLCHYPNGFQKTIHGIRLLQEHQIDVKLSSSLAKNNVNDIAQIFSIGNEWGIPVRIDTYMMPAQRERSLPYPLQSRVTPEKAAEIRVQSLKEEMGDIRFKKYLTDTLSKICEDIPASHDRKMSCFAGKCSFTINWQGKLRPCVVLTEPSPSVFEFGFSNAWKYMVTETSKIQLHAKCSTCKLRPLCRTCAACALLEGGSYDALPEYMCRYAQKTFEILETEASYIL